MFGWKKIQEQGVKWFRSVKVAKERDRTRSLTFSSWIVSHLKNCQFWFFVSNSTQFDPEGFGEIPWEDFGRALRSPEFRQHIEPHKIQQLEEKFHLQQQLDKEQEDNKSGCSGGGGHHDDDRPSRTSAITFQDFVNVVSFSKLTFFFRIFTFLID